MVLGSEHPGNTGILGCLSTKHYLTVYSFGARFAAKMGGMVMAVAIVFARGCLPCVVPYRATGLSSRTGDVRDPCMKEILQIALPAQEVLVQFYLEETLLVANL